MPSLLNRIISIARSPQGRRFATKAGSYARSPRGRAQLERVRRQIAGRRR